MPRPNEHRWIAVREYLVKTRKLPAAMVDRLHERGLIYVDNFQCLDHKDILRQNNDFQLFNNVVRSVEYYRMHPVSFTKLCSTTRYGKPQFSYNSIHLLLQPGGRGDCSYYANPETLRVNGSERFLSVLHTGSPMDCTVCNGIFEFKVLSVKCDTNEVSYSDQLLHPRTGLRTGTVILMLQAEYVQ
jgi:hypothetical protein